MQTRSVMLIYQVRWHTLIRRFQDVYQALAIHAETAVFLDEDDTGLYLTHDVYPATSAVLVRQFVEKHNNNHHVYTP